MKPDLPDFLEPLIRITDGYPTQAIEAAIQRRDESVPHLIRALEVAQDDPEDLLDDPRYMLHVYAIFILGYLKEPRALEAVLTLARNPDVDEILGDVTTTGLGETFANLCNDRPEVLYSLVEDAKVDVYVRSAALQALGTLYHNGNLSRESLASYLSQLYETKLEKRASYVWDSAVSLSADFRMIEHLPAIRDAYANGYCDPFVDLLEDVEAAIAGKINDAHRLREYRALGHPHDELQRWHCFDSDWDPDPVADELDDEDLHDEPMWDFGNAPKPETPIGSDRLVSSGTTFQRDTPKIGRNDPCPCGSGKKFKKCCGG